MRCRSTAVLVCLAFLTGPTVRAAFAADPPARKPLGVEERNAVLALIKAVDLARQTDVTSAEHTSWNGHVLKSANQSAYVPFRLLLAPKTDGFKTAVVYIRAVSRHDGIRAADEHSVARDWLLRGNSAPPRPQETIIVGSGELPIGGPAVGSSRTAVSGPAQASALLALRQRDLEREKAAAEEAKKKRETRQRDPFVFPFEDYYVADLAALRGGDARALERALSLPPGEFDVYIAMLDRARVKTSGPVVVHETLVIPDFWNDELALSSPILAADVHTLTASPSPKQQFEHPYTFGRAEVVPIAAPAFKPGDALSVVYQICNYGAPDSDLQAEYNFYRVDEGPRKLFNRTPTQQFGDDDLPTASPWETVAFASQTVSLDTFPPGEYELEITVRDRLTRHSASTSVAFSVAPR